MLPAHWQRYRFEIICLLPFLLYLGFFTLVPLAQVFQLSFAEAGAGFSLGPMRRLWAQPDFMQALRNTVIIALGSLAMEICFGLVLALALSALGRRGGWLRTIFILPLAVPTVVAAVMMTYLFATSGWINRMLTDLGLISQNIVWLSGDAYSLFAVMVADCWKVTPLVMLILLAGLQGIDQQLYQAAEVDGANVLQRFRHVTLPLLLPAITAAIIVRGIDAFRIFDLALVLTGENLKVMGTYAYLAYAEYQDIVLSAASSVVLFGMIFMAIVLHIRLVGRKGFETA
ncbi:MAG: carbohydrate ABC transporter permease [Kiritimatiellia bacterium]